MSDKARWTVPKLWQGARCWILGGGLSAPRQFNVPEEIITAVVDKSESPRLYEPYFRPLYNERTIAINNAYLIANWIDVMFFGDGAWYLKHKRMLREWPGVKVSCSPRFANMSKDEAQGIKFLARDREHTHGISKSRSMVSWNNNSGAAAISLAVHLGVRQIILLGFDMNLQAVNNKQFSHWHGAHGKTTSSKTFQRHLKGFPAIKKDADLLDVEIFNANPDSAIQCFPKTTVSEILT